MTKDKRTVPHRVASAEEEESIPTQLQLGLAWTQNMIFCQNPDFYLFTYFCQYIAFLFLYNKTN
jgi:hypothetical protein